MKPDIQKKGTSKGITTWHVTPRRMKAEITTDKEPIVIRANESAEHKRQLREWGIL